MYWNSWWWTVSRSGSIQDFRIPVFLPTGVLVNNTLTDWVCKHTYRCHPDRWQGWTLQKTLPLLQGHKKQAGFLPNLYEFVRGCLVTHCPWFLRPTRGPSMRGSVRYIINCQRSPRNFLLDQYPLWGAKNWNPEILYWSRSKDWPKYIGLPRNQLEISTLWLFHLPSFEELRTKTF